MKALCKIMPALVVFVLLVSCGGEQRESVVVEAGSMEEALTLAAETNSFVVVEFWMDG